MITILFEVTILCITMNMEHLCTYERHLYAQFVMSHLIQNLSK